MECSVFNFHNKSEVGKIDVSDICAFEFDSNFIAMHLRRSKSASFVPTNKTKNISEVSGTTKKPYKQKHTGNARQGSLRSAQFVGGGIAFGPRGVRRFVKIPKFETALAKVMLLSECFRKNVIYVVDNTNFVDSKTKSANLILSQFGQKQKTLIIHNNDISPNSILAVRNIPFVQYVSLNMLTCHDIVHSDVVIISRSVVENLLSSLSVISDE